MRSTHIQSPWLQKDLSTLDRTAQTSWPEKLTSSWRRPVPSWPAKFLPQVNTSPSFVSSALNREPQLIWKASDNDSRAWVHVWTVLWKEGKVCACRVACDMWHVASGMQHVEVSSLPELFGWWLDVCQPDSEYTVHVGLWPCDLQPWPSWPGSLHTSECWGAGPRCKPCPAWSAPAAQQNRQHHLIVYTHERQQIVEH